MRTRSTQQRGRERHRRRRLLAALMATAAAAGCGGTGTGPPDVAEPYASAVMSETNAARTAEGLPPLGTSTCAVTAAGARARALVGSGELAHQALADVIRGCAPATTAAENLSRASAPAVDVVDAWMQSPGHRANILDPALTEIGVACVDDGDEILCSEVFLGP